MVSINQLFMKMNEWGFLDSVLPFLLIFTIIFAVLQRTMILGADAQIRPRKNYNVIVAMVLSLTVVIPHIMGTYPPGQDAIVIINSAIPSVAILIVAIVLFLIIAGVVSPGALNPADGLRGIATIFAFVAIVLIFGNSAGWWSGFFLIGPLADPDTQALIIIILVFAVVIFTITAEPNQGGNQGRGFMNFMQSLDPFQRNH